MSKSNLKISQESTSLGDLIRNIEQSHHAFTQRELERISAMLLEMADTALPDLGEIRSCFAELHADLIPHLMKEERILFPYITALERDPAHPPHSCFGSVINPIQMMRFEHASVKALLEKMRALTHQYSLAPGNKASVAELYAALSGLDDDLVLHMHQEDDVLFPRALELENAASA